MLNKIKSLNYEFNDSGEFTRVSVSFNDYSGNPNGNLNIRFANEDGELDNLSPAQIQTIAKEKIIEELSKEGVEEEPEGEG